MITRKPTNRRSAKSNSHQAGHQQEPEKHLDWLKLESKVVVLKAHEGCVLELLMLGCFHL